MDKSVFSAENFEDGEFRKSSHSGTNGACVEVAQRTDVIAVRDSKNPRAATLVFTPDEWTAFVKGVRDGEFGS